MSSYRQAEGTGLTQRGGGGKGLPATGVIAAERLLFGVCALVLFLGGKGGEVLDAEVALEWLVCAVVSIARAMRFFFREEKGTYSLCV